MRNGLMVLLVVLLSAPLSAQDTGIGVGADGVLWASGWTHAQLNVPLTRELRIQMGAGMLRSADSPVSALLRPRPVLDRMDWSHWVGQPAWSMAGPFGG